MRALLIVTAVPLALAACDMRGTFREVSLDHCRDDYRYIPDSVSRADFEAGCQCAVDRLMKGREALDLMSEGGDSNNTAWRPHLAACLTEAGADLTGAYPTVSYPEPGAAAPPSAADPAKPAAAAPPPAPVPVDDAAAIADEAINRANDILDSAGR